MTLEEIKSKYPWHASLQIVEKEWRDTLASFCRKIIVLDDDPTGIQTVQGVAVYTRWNKAYLKLIESDSCPVSFVWTNSRAMNIAETEKLYKRIARDICTHYLKTGREFIVISRSDSTLRGNYPQETRAFYETWKDTLPVDAEIIVPFFAEGGRYTIEDTHYVRQGETLVPCAQTEFAKDKTFEYKSSDLKQWVAEKHGVTFKERIISISLGELRGLKYFSIAEKLQMACNFDKIIVNAVELDDLKVFVRECIKAVQRGKRFIFRTAASFVNALSGIGHAETFIGIQEAKAGLFIVGSHTELTTRQINRLFTSGCAALELDISWVFNKFGLKKELARVKKQASAILKNKQSVCVFTPRIYRTFDGKSNLEIAAAVSYALNRLARTLNREAEYVVAKGGITSYEIAVKGLGIKKAVVMGQVIPGVPVICGKTIFGRSLYYTIFPGNVGGEDSLALIKQKYEEGDKA